MNITRKRFIVMRNNRSEVWCGLSKNFYFKPISEIKDTPIKTYRSQAQAKAGCSSWDRNFEVVPVIETIEIDPSANSSHMKFKVGSKVRVKNVYSGGNFDDGDIVTIKQIDNEDIRHCQECLGGNGHCQECNDWHHLFRRDWQRTYWRRKC